MIVVAMVRICIVGGSVAGLSTAHALLYEGCEVVVLERASSIVPAGAVRRATSFNEILCIACH